jgi:hypothetical protein
MPNLMPAEDRNRIDSAGNAGYRLSESWPPRYQRASENILTVFDL